MAFIDDYVPSLVRCAGHDELVPWGETTSFEGEPIGKSKTVVYYCKECVVAGKHE